MRRPLRQLRDGTTPRYWPPSARPGTSPWIRQAAGLNTRLSRHHTSRPPAEPAPCNYQAQPAHLPTANPRHRGSRQQCVPVPNPACETWITGTVHVAGCGRTEVTVRTEAARTRLAPDRKRSVPAGSEPDGSLGADSEHTVRSRGARRSPREHLSRGLRRYRG